MQCPLCINESLELMVRGEVEIDVCPRCRGVWLDRGEIDKLAGSGRAKAHKPKRSESRKRYEPRDRDDERDGRDDKKRRDDRQRRRKTFGAKIADVFDDILD